MDFESQLTLIQDSFEYHISLDYPLKNEKKKKPYIQPNDSTDRNKEKPREREREKNSRIKVIGAWVEVRMRIGSKMTMVDGWMRWMRS